MKITVDVSKIKISLSKMKVKSDNSKTLLKGVSAYHLKQVFVTFQQQGRRDEHESWKPFADQYTRKTDGVTVPAWGGVAKIRGKGTVKGRKRPSGKRITKSSMLLQDTGTGRQSFIVQLLEPKRIIYGSVLPYMGKHNSGNGVPKREILFFTNRDFVVIDDLTKNFVISEVLKV